MTTLASSVRLCAVLSLGLLTTACHDDADQVNADASADVVGASDAQKKEDAESAVGDVLPGRDAAFRADGPVITDTTPVPPDVVPRLVDAKPDAGPFLDTRSESDGPMGRDTALPDVAADAAAPTDVEAACDSSGLVDAGAPRDATAPDTRIVCEMPRYSDDCLQVAYFQCGFMGSCTDGVISIAWHEHACTGEAWVTYYECTYTCPKGCQHDYVAWMGSGKEIVADTCVP